MVSEICAIKNENAPLVNGTDGTEVLEIALEIDRKIGNISRLTTIDLNLPN